MQTTTITITIRISMTTSPMNISIVCQVITLEGSEFRAQASGCRDFGIGF